jgi:peptidoglycan/xylan/chitin deacetylase (PgdA/CDA1 family)
MSFERKLELIRLVIFSIIFLSVSPVFSFAEVNQDKLTDRTNQKLSDTSNLQSCNCVAFRFDDVQGYWLNDVQIAVMETLEKKNVPLTIGIIGGEKSQFGKDVKITNFVKDKLLTDKPLIEIANHGLNHENFGTFDKQTQNDLIIKSNERISDILGITPKVFIPPLNEFNDNTINALQNNNFTHFSSMLETSKSPYPFENVPVYHFPETSTTGIFDEKKGIFKKISNQETLDSIEHGLIKYGFAVVTMHPQEFSTIKNGIYTNQVNWKYIKDLKVLIDEIQNSDLKIVFLSQINENVAQNRIIVPNWLLLVYDWWQKEKITDKEFSDTINYLQKQNILKLIEGSTKIG